MQRNKILFLLAFIGIFTSCSWVKTDIDDCPTGVWLKIRYTCNMLDVDAAAQQVRDASIMVFDHEGNYVRRIEIDYGQLYSNNYCVEVSELPNGIYDFVVWSGLGDSHFMTTSPLRIDDLRLSLAAADKVQDAEYGDLFYGRIYSVEVTGRYAVHEVDLTKDTNVLVCQVVPASGSGDVSIDRYGIQLKSSNGVLDACNNTVPSSLVLYAPYKMQADRVEDDLNGQVETLGYAIKTLRLVQGDNSRLVLNDNDSGNVILDLPLTDFLCQISSFYTQSGRPLTAQEYLDRQDFHTVILYMSESGNSVVQCRINNWVIRLNDNINL